MEHRLKYRGQTIPRVKLKIKTTRVRVKLVKPHWLMVLLGLDRTPKGAEGLRYKVLEIEGDVRPAPGEVLDLGTIEKMMDYGVKVTSV